MKYKEVSFYHWVVFVYVRDRKILVERSFLDKVFHVIATVICETIVMRHGLGRCFFRFRFQIFIHSEGSLNRVVDCPTRGQIAGRNERWANYLNLPRSAECRRAFRREIRVKEP